MIIIGSPNRNRKQLVAYGNGLLYNWYAVDEATFAPVGWHVPTNAEFTTLSTYLGGASVAGGKMKDSGTVFWSTGNTGDNSSGFKMLGGGLRGADGVFLYIKIVSRIWHYNTYSLNLQYNLNSVVFSGYDENYGFSVRLLKDDSTWYPGMTVTDKDGNKYPTVKIGNQVWLASNWKCTKYNDGTSIPNVTDAGAWAALTTPGYCSYNNAAISEYTELF